MHMYYLLTIAGLLLSGGVAAQAQAPLAPPLSQLTHPPKGSAVVVTPQRLALEVLPSGHVVVQATVNGVAGRFFLDTGAGLTVLTRQFAQRVPGLRRQDGRFTGFRATGERLDLPLYEAPTIVVGRYAAEPSTLGVYDGEMGGVDGLLSLTAFRQQPFTIEYGHRQLVLETPASLAARRRTGRAIPLRTADKYGQALEIAAYCRVNDKLTLLVELDSGSPKDQFWLNAASAPQLGLDTTGLKRTVFPSSFSAAQHNVLYYAILAKLAPVNQPTLARTQLPVGLMTGLIHDGIVPLNWLGDQLTIDLPHRVLWSQ